MKMTDCLKLLHGVRKERDGYTARCPAHDDANPSLSGREREGKILLHCFAGCTVEAVVNSLGLTMSDLFADPANGERVNLGKKTAAEPSDTVPWRHVADYLYACGTLRKRRSEKIVGGVRKKKFVWEYRDADGAWHSGANGIDPGLYRWQEVKESTCILLVEGEKCVHALMDQSGFPATCGPHGSSTFEVEHAALLQGKRVCVFGDNDRPGLKYAHLQATAALEAGAASVRLIERLPGVGESGDVYDWLTAGHTKDELLELIKSTPELRPEDVAALDGIPEAAESETGKPKGLQLVTLDRLFREPDEQVSWLLDKHLPAGGLSLLAAKPKVGKSTLARCLAVAVLRGEDFLGRSTAQGPVIYLALEEKRQEVKHHFRSLGLTGSEPLHLHIAPAPGSALLDLYKLALQLKPGLIIIDPLQKMKRVKDGNDYAQVTLALEPFLTMARETGSHVMVVHHLGKGDRPDPADGILGSTALFGGVDTALILKRNERYRTIKSDQRYGEDLPETVLNWDRETKSVSLGTLKAEAEVSRTADAILEYLARLAAPVGEPEIMASVEGRLGLKRSALRSLVATDQVNRMGTGRRGNPFLYASAGCSFPRSPDMSGTREQPTEETPKAPMNTGAILVPSIRSAGHTKGVQEQEIEGISTTSKVIEDL